MRKILMNVAVITMGATLFTACEKDDSKKSYPVAVSNGAYVICTGNESSVIDGSVSYIDYATGTASQKQFEAKNGRKLGMTANDALVYGSKMYIVVTGENTIEVVDAKTLASIRQIKTTDLMGPEKGTFPRHITAYKDKIYVSTYGSSTADWTTYTTSGNGYVAAIDTAYFALSQTYTAGSYPEGVAISNGKLYVANSDYSMGTKASISTIDLTSGVSSITTNSLLCNPQQLAVAGEDIYVLDWGNYSSIMGGVRKVSGSEVTTLFDATSACFFDQYVLGCNTTYGSTTKEFVIYDVMSGSKQTLNLNASRFCYPNAISVDPVTGHIFIASYSQNPDYPGYANYSANGYVLEYKADGTKVREYECGVGPNAIVFNTDIEYVEY